LALDISTRIRSSRFVDTVAERYCDRRERVLV
jgi:hypothetical protein